MQLQKSQGIQFLLTFLFGALGLFYSSIMGAIIILLVAIIGGLLSGGIIAIICWPIAIITGFFTVSRYNTLVRLEETKKEEKEERRHQELMAVALSTNTPSNQEKNA